MSQNAEHWDGFTENRPDSAWRMASPDRSVSQPELWRTSFVGQTLLELGANCPEEFFTHQPGDIDEDLIFLGCIDPRDRAPGLFGPAPLGPEALRLELARARLAERRRPLVGGVLEDQP